MALVAMALMMNSASASMQVEAFIEFVEAPSADTFKLLIFNQILAFILPLMAGPFYVFMTYFWYDYGASIDVDGTTVTITSGDGLSFVGIGNFEQMFEIMLGIIPKFARVTAISFGILGESAKLSYGATEQTLIENIGLCDLLQCDTCTC